MAKRILMIVVVMSCMGISSANAAVKWRFWRKAAVTVEGANKGFERHVPADLQMDYKWSLPVPKANAKGLWYGKGMVLLWTSSRELYAINAKDGETKWVIELDNEFDYAPVITDNEVYIGMNNSLSCIDRVIGEIVWKRDLAYPASARPWVNTPTIYQTGFDSRVYSSEVRSKEWKILGSNSYAGDEDLVLTKRFLTENWHFNLKKNSSVQPQFLDGILYFGARDGYVYALSTDKSERWSFRTQGEILTEVEVTPNRVYVGSWDSFIYSLDRLTGTEQWRFPAISEIAAQPVAVERKQLVVVSTSKNGIFGIDVSTGVERFNIKDAKSVLCVGEENIYLSNANGGVIAVSMEKNAVLWSSDMNRVKMIAVDSEDNLLYITNENVLCSVSEPKVRYSATEENAMIDSALENIDLGEEEGEGEEGDASEEEEEDLDW